MKLWYVVTPEYSYTEYVCPEGGPTYDIRDVIEIEAETARDAVVLGVTEMLKASPRQYGWCREQRSDGLSPYAGVKAHLAEAPEPIPCPEHPKQEE